MNPDLTPPSGPNGPPPLLPPAPGTLTNRQKFNTLKQFMLDVFRVPHEYVALVNYRLHHLPQTNFELAQRFMQEGRLRDAVLRYRVTLWLAPNHQPSWYFLGSCYLSLGQRDKALQAFAQAYKLNPHHEETCFMLAAIDPTILPAAKRPQAMPHSIALDYFDRQAPDYDARQAQLDYRAHQFAEDLLRDHLEPKRTNHSLLDLGCGTGLMGAMLQNYCERIVGVDISRAMLDRASERRREGGSPVYNATYHQDMRQFLADADEQYELITAVHVFNYLGDFSGLMGHVPRCLVPGGLFLFQVEPYPGEGFGMLPQLSQFGHGEVYVNRLLEQHRLEPVRIDMIRAYPNTVMRQYIVRKPV